MSLRAESEICLSVLDAAADAFATLQQEGMLAQVRTLQEQIEAAVSG